MDGGRARDRLPSLAMRAFAEISLWMIEIALPNFGIAVDPEWPGAEFKILPAITAGVAPLTGCPHRPAAQQGRVADRNRGGACILDVKGRRLDPDVADRRTRRTDRCPKQRGRV